VRRVFLHFDDVGEMAPLFGDVHAVSHQPRGGYRKAPVGDGDVDEVLGGVDEQRAHLDAGRAARFNVLYQIAQREAGAHDVFHDQHVLAGDIDVQVFGDAHHAGVAVSVHAKRDAVRLDGDGYGPREVREEVERTAQHGNKHQLLAGVIGGDGVSQLGDAAFELLFAEGGAQYVRLLHRLTLRHIQAKTLHQRLEILLVHQLDVDAGVQLL
jgi:hypothetical protein